MDIRLLSAGHTQCIVCSARKRITEMHTNIKGKPTGFCIACWSTLPYMPPREYEPGSMYHRYLIVQQLARLALRRHYPSRATSGPLWL